MRSLVLLLPALALTACQQVNPNAGRFSCDAGADCGDGYECRPQFAGGGRCFKNGECADTETCDGRDENCDGRIDETFPEQGQACAVTGLLGPCATGAKVCTAGAVTCMQTVFATTERCNSLDDDCDGTSDETFDFAADEANCGGCGRTCDAGTSCLDARCEETSCDDGADDDQDGLVDCADPSCLGQACFTVTPPTWSCGARSLDGGYDAGFTDAGTLPDGGSWDGGLFRECFAPETACGNGLDDDGDGEADCLDVDCAGLTCASGTTCTNRSCPGPG